MIKRPTYRNTSDGLSAHFPIDSTDQRLTRRAAQIDALMVLALAEWGVDGGGLQTLHTDLQRDVLELVAELAGEVRVLAEMAEHLSHEGRDRESAGGGRHG